MSSRTQPSSTSQEDNLAGNVSLLEHLDLSQLNCLNEVPSNTLKSIVDTKTRNTTSAFLLSDVDEQLLLNIAFNQTVRIKAIVIQSHNASQAPKLIRILINRPSLGFEDVEDATESDVAQVIELSEEQVKEGRPILLRFVRFQSVNSLHIFVVSNQSGEEQSRIDALDVLGTPIVTTKDLSGLKKDHD